MDEGLGNLGIDFEKELEKRFEIIDNQNKTDEEQL